MQKIIPSPHPMQEVINAPRRAKYIPPAPLYISDIAPYNIGDIVTAYGGVDRNGNLRRYSISIENGKPCLLSLSDHITTTTLTHDDIEHLRRA